jgi:hypothetical protein
LNFPRWIGGMILQSATLARRQTTTTSTTNDDNGVSCHGHADEGTKIGADVHFVPQGTTKEISEFTLTEIHSESSSRK